MLHHRGTVPQHIATMLKSLWCQVEKGLFCSILVVKSTPEGTSSCLFLYTQHQGATSYAFMKIKIRKDLNTTARFESHSLAAFLASAWLPLLHVLLASTFLGCASLIYRVKLWRVVRFRYFCFIS